MGGIVKTGNQCRISHVCLIYGRTWATNLTVLFKSGRSEGNFSLKQPQPEITCKTTCVFCGGVIFISHRVTIAFPLGLKTRRAQDYADIFPGYNPSVPRTIFGRQAAGCCRCRKSLIARREVSLCPTVLSRPGHFLRGSVRSGIPFGPRY